MLIVDINGTYKISIEMTARKMVHGLKETVDRLLGVARGESPAHPGMEDQIQSIVQDFKATQDVFDAFSMTIANSEITVRTGEGEVSYCLKEMKNRDATHAVLELDSPEMGRITWDVSLLDGYFFIDSVDGLSEYVFQKESPS